MLSNYTTTIETDTRIFKWNDSNMDLGAFIGNKKILKDLREYTANEYPEISRPDLKYFDTYMNEPRIYEEVFCIDIKSAYASILYLDGFISKDTFNYISTLSKKERLAAVGMLASRHDVFYYQGAELSGHDKVINPNQNYFWHCVKRTSEIMDNIKHVTRPLFYWVDGIYFHDRADAEKAKIILSEQGFFFSEKKCLLFVGETKKQKSGNILNNISFFETKNLDLKYNDATKKDLEYKTFSIPVNRVLKNEIINFLINKYNLKNKNDVPESD